MKEDIYDIIAQHLTANRKQPNSQLSRWLNENSNNQVIYNSLRYHWIKGDLSREVSGEEIFERISERIATSNRPMKTGKPNNHKFLMKVAAAVALLVASVWGVYNANVSSRKVEQVAIIEKATEAGRKSTFTLSDSTVVKLNSNSRLEFPSEFDANKREVKLYGEAFFEVTKNPHKPFIVRTGDVETKVLGTSFNVSAYQNKNEILVAVVSGKVQVTGKSKSPSDTRKIVLNPNEIVTYNKTEKTLDKERFVLEEITGWKDGVFVLKDADTKAIEEKLESWYGVNVTFENQSLKEVDISANYYNEPLENVLKSLSYTLRFEYRVTGQDIRIKFLNLNE